MESKNLETKLLKGSIVFLMFTALLMTTALFTSCSETSEEVLLDDEALITAIETAQNRASIEVTDLPVAAQIELDDNFDEDDVYDVKSASDLGFEVSLVATQGTFAGEMNTAFFDTTGRLLEDRKRPKRGRRRSCFHIVFPFTVVMPDASEITLESKEDKSLIREWYTNNPDATEKPDLVFPVEIEFQDGTVETVNDTAELLAAREGCKRVRCFDIVYPYSLTLPDDSILTLNSKEDRYLVKQWYRDNPDFDERPTLVYPIELTFEDGSTITINDDTELQEAKDSCSS